MTTKFVFDNKATYTDASLTSASDSNESYTLHSMFAKPGDRMPVATTLKSPHGRQESIYWTERALEIDGVKFGVDEIRFKETGMGSLFARRWSYEEKVWRIKFYYDAKTWNVFRVVDNTPEEKPSAEFKLYKSTLVGKSLPASITFQSSVSASDTMFILIALLYSELTEHPPTSFTAGWSNNIARAITGSAFYQT